MLVFNFGYHWLHATTYGTYTPTAPCVLRAWLAYEQHLSEEAEALVGGRGGAEHRGVETGGNPSDGTVALPVMGEELRDGDAIDGDALRWHGPVRRGSPAETRPARWNLVDARTTSDGGTDGQAYA